jgi:hypothetical protein
LEALPELLAGVLHPPKPPPVAGVAYKGRGLGFIKGVEVAGVEGEGGDQVLRAEARKAGAAVCKPAKVGLSVSRRQGHYESYHVQLVGAVLVIYKALGRGRAPVAAEGWSDVFLNASAHGCLMDANHTVLLVRTLRYSRQSNAFLSEGLS